MEPRVDYLCECGHSAERHYDDSDGIITDGPCQNGRWSGVRCPCRAYRQGTVLDELTEAVVVESNYGHAGPGWYVWSVEYPDEGSLFFAERPTAAELAEHGFVEVPS